MKKENLRTDMEKTNVMRVLEQKKIPYTPHDYSQSGTTAGLEVAAALGEDPARVFKTLVTEAAGRKYYVFMVPVSGGLDLKKAAKAVGEKKIEMIPQKDLLPLTGYVHGGCSPIGMKKAFPTVVDISAKDFPTICFSAGKIGYQVETAPDDIGKAIRFTYADVADR